MAEGTVTTPVEAEAETFQRVDKVAQVGQHAVLLPGGLAALILAQTYRLHASLWVVAVEQEKQITVDPRKPGTAEELF